MAERVFWYLLGTTRRSRAAGGGVGETGGDSGGNRVRGTVDDGRPEHETTKQKLPSYFRDGTSLALLSKPENANKAHCGLLPSANELCIQEHISTVVWAFNDFHFTTQ